MVRVNTGGEADVEGLAAAVPQLVRGGVTELVVEVPWAHEMDLTGWYERIRAADAGAAG